MAKIAKLIKEKEMLENEAEMIDNRIVRAHIYDRITEIDDYIAERNHEQELRTEINE